MGVQQQGTMVSPGRLLPALLKISNGTERIWVSIASARLLYMKFRMSTYWSVPISISNPERMSSEVTSNCLRRERGA